MSEPEVVLWPFLSRINGLKRELEQSLHDERVMRENLKATQHRCTELLNEVRGLRAHLRRLLPQIETNVADDVYRELAGLAKAEYFVPQDERSEVEG